MTWWAGPVVVATKVVVDGRRPWVRWPYDSPHGIFSPSPTKAQMDELRDRLEAALAGMYAIQRELGGGGMSRTYLAVEHALNRRVVVKVLAPELLAGISVERFRREVLLAAQLQHPQVVPVLAAGDAGGLPWFTMPYVDGDSLRRRLESGPIGTGEVISILRDVARALAYAHAHGVVHRDIKPDNVLLSAGSATVTDFGIAKAISAARTDGGRQATLDAGGDLHRHAHLHGTGAGRGGPERRPPGGHLRLRRHGLRADRGPAAVPGHHPGTAPGRAHDRIAARPALDPRRRPAPPGRTGHGVSGQGPRRASPAGEGAGPGAGDGHLQRRRRGGAGGAPGRAHPDRQGARALGARHGGRRGDCLGGHGRDRAARLGAPRLAWRDARRSPGHR